MFSPLLRTAIRTRRLGPARQQPRIRPRTYTSNKSPTSPTNPTASPSSTSATTASSQTSSPRLHRLLARTPTFLHRHILALSAAPVSHITSFLLLHEITALVPLFSLAALFHYTHWLPSWFAEGAWVLSGVEKFGKYFRKKGWIGEEERREAGHVVVGMQEQEHDEEVEYGQGEKKNKSGILGRKDEAWNIGEGGVRIVVEFATAYAITKALLVPRIMFSVWATPAFARWTVVPIMRRAKGMFGTKKKD